MPVPEGVDARFADLFTTWLAMVALNIEGDEGAAAAALIEGHCDHCLRVMLFGSVGAYARVLLEDMPPPVALEMVRAKIAQLQP